MTTRAEKRRAYREEKLTKVKYVPAKPSAQTEYWARKQVEKNLKTNNEQTKENGDLAEGN